MKLLVLSLILQVCHSTPLRENFELTIIGDKRLFFATDFQLNFYDAAHYCRRIRMNLLSINSEEEHRAIVKHVKDNQHANKSFWTSGNDLGEEGQFYWLSNGKRIIYTNWFKGEPNNRVDSGGVSENCVLIWHKIDFKWNDGHCHVPLNFICEL